MEKAAGLALIGSVAAMVVTMSFHPTGHEVMASAAATRRAIAVHSLALSTIPLALFGLLVLTERLRSERGLSLFAYVTYAFGAVATLGAAVAGGFLASSMATYMRAGEGMRREAFRALFIFSGQMNQAFAYVHVIVQSIAILVWSIAIWRARGPRWLAIAGMIIGAGIPLLALAGHLSLHVHGAAAVYFAHGVWMIGVAAMLWRTERA